jgi:hypothetical protein
MLCDCQRNPQSQRSSPWLFWNAQCGEWVVRGVTHQLQPSYLASLFIAQPVLLQLGHVFGFATGATGATSGLGAIKRRTL